MRRDSMKRDRSSLGRTGVWFLVSGVLVLSRAVLELSEPVYWSPVTPLDFTAAVLTTVAWIATGVSFILWWQSIPIRRGALLLLVSGVGTAVSGIGNFIEDVLDHEWGGFLFSYGGLGGALAAILASLLILTVRHPLRWSGLVVLAFIAGGAFPDDGGQLLSGISLVGLGYWFVRYSGESDE
jgi:hypothetical protein